MKIVIAALFIFLFTIAGYFALFGGDAATVFIAVTAVAAFGISLFNFYHEHFRSVHDLKSTLVAIGYNGKSFTAHYTFENIGTHQEIVIGVTFVFPEDRDGKQFSTLTKNHHANDRMPELMEPFVISPKEVILKKFEWDIAYTDLLIHFKAMHGPEFRLQQTGWPLALKIDFVNPKTRTKSSKVVRSADIAFYDDFVSIWKPYAQQNRLFEGALSSI